MESKLQQRDDGMVGIYFDNIISEMCLYLSTIKYMLCLLYLLVLGVY